MPVERRGWVTHGVCWVNGRPEEPNCLTGRRQPSLSGTSRMRRESHVRICERLGVKFPGPTRRTTVLLVEQNAHMALKVADWGYVLETGRLAFGGDPATLWSDERIRDAYLGGGEAKAS